MADSPVELTFAQRVLTMQIIVGTLAFGAGAALVFLASTSWPPPQPAPPFSLYSMFALATTAGALGMSRLVPSFILAKQRKELIGDRTADRETTEERLLAAKQTALIVGAAVCEGVAMFCGIAYQVDHQVTLLAVGAAMIVPIVLLMPTAGGLRRWLDDELRTIDELRQLDRG